MGESLARQQGMDVEGTGAIALAHRDFLGAAHHRRDDDEDIVE